MKKRQDGRVMKSRTIEGKRLYGYGKNQKEAQADLDKKVEKMKAGLYKPGKEQTLEEYFVTWMKSREGTVKPTTLYNQEVSFRPVLRMQIDKAGTLMGNMKLSKIEPQHVRTVQAELAKTQMTESVNNLIKTLKACLKAAVNERIIPWNPCDPVRSLRRTEEAARDTYHRALTNQELSLFFEQFQKRHKWYIPLLKFLLYTGVRIGEAGALYVSDIKDGKITIKRSLTVARNGIVIVGQDAKTRSGIRSIPLTPEAKQAVETQLKWNHDFFKDEVKPEYQNIIFRSPRGCLIARNEIARQIRLDCAKAGIEIFTPHAFRDTFATRAIASGMSPKTLQTILGHANIGITMNLYTHAMEEQVEKEMQAVKINFS